MKEETAIFAGGCFWCMVEPFEKMPGILKVRSGYTGGHLANPTYRQVCSHTTGHVEAVKIWYDAEQISYQQLLDIYWMIADPTDATGQFADRGNTYRPIIFVNSKQQAQIAEASKQKLAQSNRFDRPIVTQILPAQVFYDAEEEHQDFYRKDPAREAMMMGPRLAYQQKYWADQQK
ncbi:peptide-methionine (S)-S-oxide reductase MsrA [Weissella diestrammenae]|uniref:Peptide methionine sulfoxide reductase MsrA n=1 Tax=Weissella diestrammenae TaxID=1162633 RepID=A0A7G9T7D2_9LACO|nr:peptide-methionine (S)-S-oxide reductase MsrA [Weissella diestrammenae]MCM0582020.1 peptide-methionine (S)-S-oxide reductase MsrA [Weissella diestrammenae]QNN76007.1 peptide-methionine (S)-S-oxide reductase MsrA [Weissella diestrammenae]